MSKYHANCTNDQPEQPNRAGPALTSKVRNRTTPLTFGSI